MNRKLYEIAMGTGPLVGAAIHDGNEVRDGVANNIALTDAEQLREEDPCTGEWTAVANTRIIGLHSRFEVDLNRPREKAVYLKPEDAWGLKVWHASPADEIVKESLGQYDVFYEEIQTVLTNLQHQYEHVVVYDLHTYNHRREGPDHPPADPLLNPEVNIGTGTMNREYWAPLVDRLINDLGSFNYLGRKLDVRENVKFQGGNFSRWIHQEFPEKICSIAIEFKKFFMDEWTAVPDMKQVKAIKKALQSTVPGVLEELEKFNKSSD